MQTKPQFQVMGAPHFFRMPATATIMWMVVLALLPAWGWGIFQYGLPGVITTAAAIAGTCSGEMLVQYLRSRDFSVLTDGSAILTGLLLAMVLPPQFPFFLTLPGAWFAVIVGKGLFGGLGQTIFNPALLGRAFLQVSFPAAMTTWTLPKLTQAISSATPLSAAKFDGALTQLPTLFFGLHGGSLGEGSSALLLVSGMVLIVLRIIDWRIPVSILSGAALWVLGLNLTLGPEYGTVFFHLLSGGMLLGAFFMATDYATSPMTLNGKWVYGFSIGTLVVLLRCFTGMPESIMFAILFMNALVPLINRYTRPRILGQAKAVKS